MRPVMSTSRAPLTGHIRATMHCFVRRNALNDAAGASFVFAALETDARGPKQAATFVSNAAPWQVPDRLIVVPCFEHLFVLVSAVPTTEPSGSPVRGRLPQGDSYELHLNHPQGASPRLGHSQP